jgi:phage shock protein A
VPEPLSLALCAVKTVAAAASLIAVGEKLGGEVSFQTLSQALEGMMRTGEAVKGFRGHDSKIFAATLEQAAKRLEARYEDALKQRHSAGFEDAVRVAFANLAEVIGGCLPSEEALARMNHDPDRVAATVVEAALAIRMDVFADADGEARKILVNLVSHTYAALRNDPKFVASVEGVNWAEALSRLGRIEDKIDRVDLDAERRHQNAEEAAERRHRETVAASGDTARLWQRPTRCESRSRARRAWRRRFWSLC